MATELAESVAEEKTNKQKPKRTKKKVGKPIGDPVRTGCPNEILKLLYATFVRTITGNFRNNLVKKDS